MPPPGEEDKLYPVAVLIDELKFDDVNVRVKATKQLKVIAEALGFQRTRDELVPFITEAGGGWDDEDEVLITVAEQFGDFLDFVGGPEHALTLLQPLEQLAAMEEATVRDKAVSAIQNIVAALPDSALEATYQPLLLRLGRHDWSTSRASAALLVPGLYARSRASHTVLQGLWMHLWGDDEPMVKRAAVNAMAAMARALRDPAQISEFVVKPFKELAKDEQDGVRLLCVERLVDLCGALLPEQLSKFALPLLRDAVKDPSWRVRYMVTDKFTAVAQAVGLLDSPVRLPELVGLFKQLSQDSEAEVRAAAAHQISKLSPHFATPAAAQEVGKLLTAAQKLCSDSSQHVRAAAAGNVVSLSKALGPHQTLGTLMPLLTELLRDEHAEVRLNVIGELGKVSDVVGFDELSRQLLPAVVNLASDGKWRVREAVIKEVPALARQMGADVFEKDLMRIVIGWMSDQVSEIRILVAKVLCDLVRNFGDDWFRTRLFPKMRVLAEKENYMHRFGLLQFLAQVTPLLSKTTIHQCFLQVFQTLGKDKVPNVRFNVCKAMAAALKKLDDTCLKSGWRALLYELEADTDDDVQRYASEARVSIPH
eukprot:TRINITY_DN12859_c0_g1_i1.p1 TRINITY_DN12859_c0_g1~~TRINITY_DN12859_c0_g1_i1.p1  ORF type:complete len:626 (+),score=232.67 TRINITY_DN12859_c0_g1_i1:97-1878(+)